MKNDQGESGRRIKHMMCKWRGEYRERKGTGSCRVETEGRQGACQGTSPNQYLCMNIHRKLVTLYANLKEWSMWRYLFEIWAHSVAQAGLNSGLFPASTSRVLRLEACPTMSVNSVNVMF